MSDPYRIDAENLALRQRRTIRLRAEGDAR